MIVFCIAMACAQVDSAEWIGNGMVRTYKNGVVATYPYVSSRFEVPAAVLHADGDVIFRAED